jgi:probable phosphoglycerate mutase
VAEAGWRQEGSSTVSGRKGGPALLAAVRHGQTIENARGRWLGLRDSPLTSEGRQQATALGGRLKPEGPWAAIYTSPLGRAVDTAMLLAAVLGAPVLPPERDLREYDFGEWDGLTPAELQARGFWAAVSRDREFAPPGGEGFAAAARRLTAALQGIASSHVGQGVVVVTHGLALAAGLALMLTTDARNAAQYALPNAGLALLSMDGDDGLASRLIAMDDPVSCEMGV